MGTLYLVATPIGNLEDITLRAVHVLESVPLVAAEDTRHTQKLLTHFGLRTPMISLHAHNEGRQLESILQRLARHDMALVSDAGTPALSDPGVRLVSAAVAKGYPVVPIPGPSAVLGARPVVVARELTKVHEEFLRGTPATLLEHFEKAPPRGELTVVVAGSDWRSPNG